MWALLPFALKKGFAFAEPETLSWFRLASSSVLLATWLLVTQKTQWLSRLKQMRPILLVASFGLAFNYVAYAYGLRLTTPADAQMLIQMGPFMTTFITFVFRQEKITLHFILGLFFAVLGFGIFYWDRSYHFFRSINQYQEGFWWIFAASLAWAIWAVLHRDHTRQQPGNAWIINLFVWTFCAVLVTPFAKINQIWPPSIPHIEEHILLLLFLSANTIIAYGCYSLAYLYAPTVIVNLIVSTNPILAFLLTTEAIGWKSWVGGGIVSLGLAVTFGPQWYQIFQKWRNAR